MFLAFEADDNSNQQLCTECWTAEIVWQFEGTWLVEHWQLKHHQRACAPSVYLLDFILPKIIRGVTFVKGLDFRKPSINWLGRGMNPWAETENWFKMEEE